MMMISWSAQNASQVFSFIHAEYNNNFVQQQHAGDGRVLPLMPNVIQL